MCAKDGGVQVYETVTLPPEKFDKYGLIKNYRASRNELALGPEYVFKGSKDYYRRGSPDLIRWHWQIIRQLDGKLLGETLSYERGGGDIPGPWQPSSYVCPDVRQAGPNALIKSIFISSKGD
jgi:hypothetical protein